GLYEGVPKALPALARAAKIQRRAANAGFDPWPDTDAVLAGLAEELNELRAETSQPDPDAERVEAELGDVLFAAAALGHHLGVDPESALRRMLERAEVR